MGNNNNQDHVNEVMDSNIANGAAVATVNELKRKTNINDQTAYVLAEPYTANPNLLLGQVVEIRKTNGDCPTSLVNGSDLNFEFSAFPVTGFKIDEEARQSKPVLRSSIIVDKAICAEIGFLNFLSGQLDSKSSFSLVVMDQAKGLINVQDDSWKGAVNTWKKENEDKMNDPDICFIYVVTGYIQKNIIKKKYSQFDGTTKGGAYGVNINGKLSLSTDDYSLDVIFGLSPAIIKRPVAGVDLKNRAILEEHEPDSEQQKLFGRISGAKLTK